MPARHCQNAEDITYLLNSISPVGWLVVPIRALAAWFDFRSRTGASRFEDNQIGKRAGSASCTPPAGM